MPISLTRRSALLAGVSAPVALAAPLPSLADGHGAKTGPMSNARRFKVGALEVSTLLAGTTPREEPHKIFGLNVSEEEFKKASAENFIPDDMAQFYFTPTVVNTGSEVILFDTGLAADGTSAALAEAGYSPEDVTHVVITHMHGDHIGGLMKDGTPTFANAAYITGQVEYDHWAAAGNERFDGNVKPLAEKMTFLGDGDSVASGITAMAAFGHTPGHMTYMLESEGKQLLIGADMTNHYVWSLAYPDWEVRFDMDKAAAAATRRKVLGMLAADKVPMIGYHMPFPGLGYVQSRDDGFRYVPVSYQFM
ncbi:glyoxylase-like metal-dependent hydrolase (beta-lactamase superfamily II) [Aliiruegeria haliotis]|uniref:Glyoxylase-like metal-dependent hydrolase (Beta-lactamase superfamily II) n=1 Tax=Aliiruegeria haliotis TaxID=1280846 RepID=A0A2T0RKV4_9RHOB|nr:MBL fold metallo-hydrolase [Aliiruegeria haliotis]PRY21767.1 glyoxylase-like metal-dependent hydrolase (beta-lactamase superfamily II) [Aliiruegeria haliotis]